MCAKAWKWRDEVKWSRGTYVWYQPPRQKSLSSVAIRHSCTDVFHGSRLKTEETGRDSERELNDNDDVLMPLLINDHHTYIRLVCLSTVCTVLYCTTALYVHTWTTSCWATHATVPHFWVHTVHHSTPYSFSYIQSFSTVIHPTTIYYCCMSVLDMLRMAVSWPLPCLVFSCHVVSSHVISMSRPTISFLPAMSSLPVRPPSMIHDHKHDASGGGDTLHTHTHAR